MALCVSGLPIRAAFFDSSIKGKRVLLGPTIGGGLNGFSGSDLTLCASGPCTGPSLCGEDQQRRYFINPKLPTREGAEREGWPYGFQ